MSGRPEQIDALIAEEQAKLNEMDERRNKSGKPPSEASNKKYAAISAVIDRLKGERDRFK
eukprot:CAMPEP_0174736880 /NCGR_PEP_ID=MMETSP1094-20130205/67440_1 /TAXON_ID=156173 /ORGANISM="Chrysochromulina brevifilum, Strain UTEX LB 985" /LENGTH=59 /DNA_ID=CAMNT_0015940049 /DNA_START=70 /DNA_END=249 /DNA_ORIENTATION=+